MSAPLASETPQAVQREQRGQRMLCQRPEPGGYQ